MERERNGDKEGKKMHAGLLFLFLKSAVTLSPTTKIFFLENELTKKEVRV